MAVASGDLGHLTISHSTVVPAIGAVTVADTNLDLALAIDRCITGAIEIPEEGPSITITTTVVDGALAVPHCDVGLDAVTVLGDTTCRTLTASDCIFAAGVTVERTQDGCVRFSYVQDGSRTPRRFRCQPDLVLESQPPPSDPAGAAVRLIPQFTSIRFGDPGYGMLDDRSAHEILTGSTAQTDMGAFGFLSRPLRDANVKRRSPSTCPSACRPASTT